MLRPGCAIVLILITASACHRPASQAEWVASTVGAVNQPDFAVLWKSCLEVLRRHSFRIDREDLRAGVITTHPETSQHFFELWRYDVATPFDWAEATLHTMRRWVEIKISHPHEGEEYRIEVTVNKQRYRTVERQITNPAGALRLFSTDAPTTRGEKYRQQKDSGWMSLGRDGAMEEYLLDEMLKRYSLLTAQNQDSPTTESQLPNP